MEQFTEKEILAFRKQTKGCANVIHLNNAGASLMPDPVTKTIIDHVVLESEIGGYEAAALRDETIREFYPTAANLLNCQARNIAFTASATDSFTRALSSIPFKASDTILTSNDDYISNQIHYHSLQKRFGVKVVRIKNSASGG
ncbi:MAG TPA: aminotransferase class V-fold PLP-dependent enzyme, partial [Flavitalea sp.]|nr:aminotransferase class V-fold PLP-dependent enzyme [Flavitalea sp.]